MDVETFAGGTNIDTQHFQAERARMDDYLHERDSRLGTYSRNDSLSDILDDICPRDCLRLKSIC